MEMPKPVKKTKSRAAVKRAPKAKTAKLRSVAPEDVACTFCEKHLPTEEKALFVEEDVGRVFCSEECIVGYFTPEIELLEKNYLERVRPEDFTIEERERLLQLRWPTMEKPDEVWCEQTVAGDRRYSLLGRYKIDGQAFWCVCISLFLRGEPSFLFIAVVSKDEALVETYRRGERVEMGRPKMTAKERVAAVEAAQVIQEGQDAQDPVDHVADPFTDEETFRARVGLHRNRDDIARSDFSNFHALMDPTLQQPDEVWVVEPATDKVGALFHFVKHFSEHEPKVWYVVVGRESLEQEDQLEVLDAFPTRDPALLDQFRTGTQEIGESEGQIVSRTLH